MSMLAPPPRRPTPATDDHGQPVGPPRRRAPYPPYDSGPNLWLWFVILALIVVTVLAVVLPKDDPGGLVMPIVIAVVVIALLALILANVRIVPQANAYVIERLGKFKGVWSAGIHVKIPLIDRIANKVL